MPFLLYYLNKAGKYTRWEKFRRCVYSPDSGRYYTCSQIPEKGKKILHLKMGLLKTGRKARERERNEKRNGEKE